MSVWFWDWHESKYIKRLKQGVVYYTKPSKNNYIKENKQNETNRRLETKRVRTHNKK